MHAKTKKALTLSTETVRRLNDREVLEVAFGGATRLCTGAVSTCLVYTCYC